MQTQTPQIANRVGDSNVKTECTTDRLPVPNACTDRRSGTQMPAALKSMKHRFVQQDQDLSARSGGHRLVKPMVLVSIALLALLAQTFVVPGNAAATLDDPAAGNEASWRLFSESVGSRSFRSTWQNPLEMMLVLTGKWWDMTAVSRDDPNSLDGPTYDLFMASEDPMPHEIKIGDFVWTSDMVDLLDLHNIVSAQDTDDTGGAVEPADFGDAGGAVEPADFGDTGGAVAPGGSLEISEPGCVVLVYSLDSAGQSELEHAPSATVFSSLVEGSLNEPSSVGNAGSVGQPIQGVTVSDSAPAAGPGQDESWSSGWLGG